MAEAGGEFELVVREAMVGAGLSLSGLARESGIERGRWYAWFRGENAPQPRILRRATGPLGRTINQLVAPWGAAVANVGRDTDDQSALVSALMAQTTALTGLVADLRASLRGVERGLTAAAKLREDAALEASIAPRSRADVRR